MNGAALVYVHSTMVMLVLWLVFTGLVCRVQGKGQQYDPSDCPGTCKCGHPQRIPTNYKEQYNMAVSNGMYINHCPTDSYNHIVSMINKYPLIDGLELSNSLKHTANMAERMTRLIANMTQLTSLKVLSISDNNLGVLPHNIGDLRTLVLLNVKHNKLTQLPYSVGQLTLLESLGFDNNRLTQLPSSIGNLTSLVKLWAYNNRLVELPASIGYLPSLRVLTVSGNRLTQLPYSIGNLTSLVKLWAHTNRLLELPTSMAYLLSLQHLYVDNNNLSHLPITIGQLPVLQTIRAHHNRITAIDLSLVLSVSGRVVDLSHNQISMLNSSSSSLTNNNGEESLLDTMNGVTWEVDLSHNHVLYLHDLSDWFKITHHELINLLNNKTLLLENNPIRCDCVDYAIYKELKSSAQPPSLSCGSPASLKGYDIAEVELDKFTCQIISDCPDGCVCRDIPNQELLTVDCRNYTGNALPQVMPKPLWKTGHFRYTLDFEGGSLVTLGDRDYLQWVENATFSQNDIDKISTGFFDKLKKINVLKLDNNNIKALTMWGNSVRFLNVSHNAISNITHHGSYSLMQHTTHNVTWKVDLSHNNVQYLHDVLESLDITEYELVHHLINEHLILANNPLRCDCVDYAIYKELKSSTQPPSLSCGSPASLTGYDIAEVELDKFTCQIISDCPDGCVCTYIPNQELLTVDCRNYTGNALPQVMPKPLWKTGHFRYTLDFKGGSLVALGNRDYLKWVENATFSHNNIEEISAAFFNKIANFNVLKLDNNNIKALPGLILKWPKYISLGHNNWTCICENEATIKRIDDQKKAVLDYQNVCCSRPDGLKSLKFDQVRYMLCPKTNEPNKTNEPDYFYVLFIAPIALVVFIFLTVGLTFGIIHAKRVWVYKKFKWHPFDRVGNEEEAMKEFDIFVSYCDDDINYIYDDILSKLEELGFKICHHRETFLAGYSIIGNIHRSINSSKRTLVYLSQAYMNSKLCMHEFHTALAIHVKERSNLLVTIKAEDINVKALKTDVRSFLENYTYVEQGSPHFWDNLLYILPVPRMNAHRTPDADNGAEGGEEIEMNVLNG